MSNDKIKIIEKLIIDFSDKFQDEEFKTLNIRLLHKLEDSDFSLNRGKAENWACSIIFAIGQLNFIFEYYMPYYINNDTLCAYFKANKQTIWQKARDIRRFLKLKINNADFTTDFVLSLNLPDSDVDLKRIRTFTEIKYKLRQNRPKTAEDINNHKILKVLNELKLNKSEEKIEELILLLRPSFFIKTHYTQGLSDDKFLIPLFTSIDKHEAILDMVDNHETFVWPFINVLDYLGGSRFEGIMINPESDNILISPELLSKVYIDHENIDYYNIFY